MDIYVFGTNIFLCTILHSAFSTEGCCFPPKKKVNMIQSKVHVKVAALHCTRSGACVELTKMRNLKHYVERRNQHAYAVMVAFEAEVERPSTNGLHEDVWDKAFYHLASYLLATCNTSHSVSMLLFALIPSQICCFARTYNNRIACPISWNWEHISNPLSICYQPTQLSFR